MTAPKHAEPDPDRPASAPTKRTEPRSPLVRVLRVLALLAALLVFVPLAAMMAMLVVTTVTGLDVSDDSDELADYPKRVSALDATVDVARDGTVTVTERLTYHHGPGAEGAAYRVIPAAGEIEGYGRVDFGLGEVKVLDSDGVEPVSVTRRGNADSSTTVTIGSGTLHGDHTFVLRYSYDSLLVRGENGPRLFLDVVGGDWTIPVAATRLTVHSPDGPLQARCYAGEPGSYTRCKHRSTHRSSARISADVTLPGDAVTVDVDLAGLDSDVDLVEGWDESHPTWWDRVSGHGGGLGLFTGLALLFGYVAGRCFFALIGRPWPFSGGSGGGFGGGGGGGGGGGAGGGGGGGGGG